ALRRLGRPDVLLHRPVLVEPGQAVQDDLLLLPVLAQDVVVDADRADRAGGHRRGRVAAMAALRALAVAVAPAAGGADRDADARRDRGLALRVALLARMLIGDPVLLALLDDVLREDDARVEAGAHPEGGVLGVRVVAALRGAVLLLAQLDL